MTTAMHNAADELTTPQLASLLCVPEWTIRAAMRRGLIAPPRKHGPTFLWTAADLDRVRAGLRQAGYTPRPEDEP